MVRDRRRSAIAASIDEMAAADRSLQHIGSSAYSVLVDGLPRLKQRVAIGGQVMAALFIGVLGERHRYPLLVKIVGETRASRLYRRTVLVGKLVATLRQVRSRALDIFEPILRRICDPIRCPNRRVAPIFNIV